MKIFYICLISLILIGSPSIAKKHILYVGTYTTGLTDGIFVYSFNDRSGKLIDLKTPALSNNPSFLTVSANKKFLYAVGELNNLDQNQSGGLTSFSIGKKGALTLKNSVLTHGANPCHVCLSPDGKRLVSSNYTGGNISVFTVFPDGSISDMIQRIQHVGSGPFKGRQDEPHAHSSKFDSSGKHLYTADLGIDELKIYALGTCEIPLAPAAEPFIKLPAGSGPRHFEFSADGRFIYVINELSSTITVFMKYGGEWKQVQNISTLPKDFKGESWCADIHLSADGRFVYGSNRGNNSIATLKRDSNSGKLEFIEAVSVEGNWPRNFAIDPSGNFLLAANQKSNDITVFKIDPITGRIRYTGIKVPNQSPVCLQFLE